MQKPTDDSADARLALFDFAFQHAPIGIVLVDTRGRIIRGNSAFSRLVGISSDEVVGMSSKDFTHPDDLEPSLARFKEVLAGKTDGYTIEKRYIRPTGEIVHVLLHVAAMRDAKGDVVRFISQIEDVTQHKNNERDLAERAAQLELAMEAIRGGFWCMDINTGKFETSDRLSQFIGGPAAARLDLDNYLTRVNVEDGGAADLTPLINGSVDQSVAEYRLNTLAGERWMRCDRRLLRDAEGVPVRIVGVAIDFTDEHLRIDDLERNAQTDKLTGVLNRRGLEARFPAMASSSGYALLAIDLDGFKEVNDQHGHPAGDAVLVEAARRLTAAVRSTDLVCRIGGDEFIVITAGDREAGTSIANRIVEAMRVPISVDNLTAKVRASVGGLWTNSKTDLATLVSEADILLYRAKAAGKDCAMFG